MSIFSLLPIMMSISFFFVFKQKLKNVEILGIILSVGGVILIAFSKENPAFANEKDFVHPIWSILALIVSLTLIVIRYTLFKYEEERVKGANTSILRSITALMTGIPILIASFVYWGIEGFSWRYVIVGFLAGVIANVANNFGLRATVMAKGGPATAVIETAMIFQTICDFLYLGQKPNFLELIGLIVGFIATIVIVIGD